MLLRPEWAGPLRSDSSTSHKAGLAAVCALMLVVGGADMLRLQGSWSPTIPGFSPATETNTTSVTLLGKTYRLGAYNQKANPTWEFVTTGETVNNWTTLLTLIERSDSHTRGDLDRLAEGIMANYKSHGGQILFAKTMQDPSGKPYNYLAAAFEVPAKRTYELNFVKIAHGAKNATIIVYGVHITDPQDYQAKAKQFLTRESDSIGKALAAAKLPDMTTLPRKEF